MEVLQEADAEFTIIRKGPCNSSALGTAAKFGHVDVMEAIIGAAGKVNAAFHAGSTALHYPPGEVELDTIDTLIEAEADMETKTDEKHTPLLVAACQESFETISALLGPRADPNAKSCIGDTGLHMSCTVPKVGFEDVLGELLQRGAEGTLLDCD